MVESRIKIVREALDQAVNDALSALIELIPGILNRAQNPRYSAITTAIKVVPSEPNTRTATI